MDLDREWSELQRRRKRPYFKPAFLKHVRLHDQHDVTFMLRLIADPKITGIGFWMTAAVGLTMAAHERLLRASRAK